MFGAVGVAEVQGWVERLCVAPATFDEVRTHTALACRLRNWTDAVLASLARAAGGYSALGMGASATAVLQDAGRLSATEARAVARRGVLTADAPVVADALAGGLIGVAHADAMARIAARAGEPARRELLARSEDLVAVAGAMTPESFARHCEQELRAIEADGGLSRFEQQRAASKLTRWTDRGSGMLCVRAELDPEWGGKVFGALDAEIERLWAERPTEPGESVEAVLEHLGAKALVNLVGHGHATRTPEADLHAFVDVDTLIGGLHAHGICELGDGTPLPVETLRRLACTANIVPVVLGSDGEVLDCGRQVRLATRSQRRALRAMCRTCAIPGCDVPFGRCEIHHVQPFEALGGTDLANLVPLCWRHHHLVHEGGWRLAIDTHRTLTLTRPDGHLHAIATLADTARWARPRPGQGRGPGLPRGRPGDHGPPMVRAG